MGLNRWESIQVVYHGRGTWKLFTFQEISESFFLLSPTQLQFEVFHPTQDKRGQGSSHTQISGWANLSTQTPLLVYSASRVCTHQGGSTSRPTPPLQRQPLPPQYPEPFLLNQDGVPSPGTEGIVSPSQLDGNNPFRQVAELSTQWHRFSSSWPPAPSSLQLGSGQEGGGVVESESKRGSFFIRIAFWWNRLILPSLIKK